MNKIKIDKGERVEMLVQVIAEVPSNYGPEVRFSGRTATDADAAIFLKIPTAERQLARLGLTRESATGRTLIFAKPDKYIDIEFPSGSLPVVAASPSAAPATSAPAPVDPAKTKDSKRAEWDKLVKCYKRCFDEAVAIATEAFDESPIPISHAGVATTAASLFEAVLTRGLCT